ncbi:MAG: winged helix-turn-helix domain-containing protein [Anaerolineae bacterium]|nr:winged helix-turn-helix domain-containing protein [Anaerolineae bacterium]
MTADLWESFPSTYRAKEMKILASWILAGESGSVVGLSGCGRSNLLDFLCHRSDALQSYLLPGSKTVALIRVDLNTLPANNLSTLYRVILRSFYNVRDQFGASLQDKICALYLENRAEQDPFLSQSALQELLSLFQSQQLRAVFVFNRFDRFCQMATPRMVNTLRSLRDEFKDTLCYIVGMAQEAAYLPDPAILGQMYELVDNYTCWVGAMNEADARNLIARATRAAAGSLSEKDITTMLALTGRFPALLRATCYWWLTTSTRPPQAEWASQLTLEPAIQRRLEKIWAGLTQEEQYMLSELQKRQIAKSEETKTVIPGPVGAVTTFEDLTKDQHNILTRLAAKGVCQQTDSGRFIIGNLLAHYVAVVEGRGRGKIWLDEQTGEIYQGQNMLKGLTNLERAVLSFLVNYPRIRHPKTDLIINTWPDELRQQGVSDNSLYQVILSLRRAIEPNPGQPVYLITWRGKPEGGYQFFPEGRPA